MHKSTLVSSRLSIRFSIIFVASFLFFNTGCIGSREKKDSLGLGLLVDSQQRLSTDTVDNVRSEKLLQGDISLDQPMVNLIVLDKDDQFALVKVAYGNHQGNAIDSADIGILFYPLATTRLKHFISQYTRDNRFGEVISYVDAYDNLTLSDCKVYANDGNVLLIEVRGELLRLLSERPYRLCLVNRKTNVVSDSFIVTNPTDPADYNISDWKAYGISPSTAFQKSPSGLSNFLEKLDGHKFQNGEQCGFFLTKNNISLYDLVKNIEKYSRFPNQVVEAKDFVIVPAVMAKDGLRLSDNFKLNLASYNAAYCYVKREHRYCFIRLKSNNGSAALLGSSVSEELADYYKTLGLEVGATPKEVHSAFLHLMKQYHSDKNPAYIGSVEKTNKFMALLESYRFLKSYAKIAASNQVGSLEQGGMLASTANCIDGLSKTVLVPTIGNSKLPQLKSSTCISSSSGAVSTGLVPIDQVDAKDVAEQAGILPFAEQLINQDQAVNQLPNNPQEPVLQVETKLVQHFPNDPFLSKLDLLSDKPSISRPLFSDCQGLVTSSVASSSRKVMKAHCQAKDTKDSKSRLDGLPALDNMENLGKCNAEKSAIGAVLSIPSSIYNKVVSAAYSFLIAADYMMSSSDESPDVFISELIYGNSSVSQPAT